MTINSNTLFPIFLKLSKLNILIIGGGNVAAEKLHFFYLKAAQTLTLLS